jgi:hypothetical protein
VSAPRRSLSALALAACLGGCAKPLPAPTPAPAIPAQRGPTRPVLSAGAAGGTTLAACSDFGAVPSPTTLVRVAAPPAELRLPGTFHEESIPVPAGTIVPQRWVAVDRSSVVISRALPGMIPGVAVVGYDNVHESQCAATFGGLRGQVAFYLEISPAARPDTLFMAGVEVPLSTGEFLSATLIARSAAGRRALLAALRDMRPAP